jgi:hypothetical protein
VPGLSCAGFVCARTAADYDRAGRPDDAALLRRMAAADNLIAAARLSGTPPRRAPDCARRGDDRPAAPTMHRR